MHASVKIIKTKNKEQTTCTYMYETVVLAVKAWVSKITTATAQK